MDRQEITEKTAQHVRGVLSGEGSGHDWFHIERVTRMALRLAQEEGADAYVTELAALLHDIADWKFAGGDHDAGSRAARKWLESLQVDTPTIDHVCEIIDGLSFKGAGVKTPMRTLEGQCVQDADRLEALGAIGIARAFAYGGHKGQPLHDPEQQPQMHASFEAYKKGSGTTINHFYEKLLLLKDRMNTASGKRLAAERHVFMEWYLRQFLFEWNGQQRPDARQASWVRDRMVLLGCGAIAFVVAFILMAGLFAIVGVVGGGLKFTM